MPGVPELVIIFLIVMVVFGAGKIPQLGDALGKGIKNFKKGINSDEIDVTPAPVAIEEPLTAEAHSTDEPAT